MQSNIYDARGINNNKYIYLHIEEIASIPFLCIHTNTLIFKYIETTNELKLTVLVIFVKIIRKNEKVTQEICNRVKKITYKLYNILNILFIFHNINNIKNTKKSSAIF